MLYEVITGNGEQLFRVSQRLTNAIESQHNAFEGLFFLAEFLGTLGIIPNRRIFELPRNGT